jgi:hypothetical protein
MMRPGRPIHVFIAFILTVVLPIAVATATPIASSTFDAGDESWRLVSTLDYDGPVTWTDTGGNPGGFIYGQDPDTGAFGFGAPSKFLGNVSDAYGETLSFDVAAYQTPDTTTSWVGIRGAGYELICYYNVPATAYPDWYARSVTMDENGGWVDASTGQPATQAQMQAALADLEGLVILAEFVDGLETDISGLDNVILMPEPTSLALFALLGLALRRR